MQPACNGSAFNRRRSYPTVRWQHKRRRSDAGATRATTVTLGLLSEGPPVQIWPGTPLHSRVMRASQGRRSWITPERPLKRWSA